MLRLITDDIVGTATPKDKMAEHATVTQVPNTGRVRTKLPVWETTTASFRSVFSENLNHLPNAAIVPFILSLLIGALSTSATGGVIEKGWSAATPGEIVFLILLFAATVVPYAIFAVAWHRLILLGPAEAPRVVPSWTQRHWRFFGYSLLVTVLIMVLMLAFAGVPALILEAIDASRLLTILIASVGMLAGAVVGLRLCAVFPAIAVETAHGLGDAMKLTAGQGLRIFAGVVLIFIPFVVIEAILQFLLPDPSSIPSNSETGAVLALAPTMVRFGINTVMNYVSAAVLISFLSIAFQHLSGWRPSAPETTSPEPTEVPCRSP